MVGNFVVRKRNREGQLVVGFAKSMEMAVINTFLLLGEAEGEM